MPQPRIHRGFIATFYTASDIDQYRREEAGLADNEHGKLASRVKTALDGIKAKASKFANEAEWAFGQKTARFLGLTLLFIVVVAALLVFLNWYVAPTKPSVRKDLVLAVAQILGGAALLSGLYFTWRTLQVNRQGQITDRFTRAIEQLGATVDGDKNMEMRLGGIYALERISKESPEDHWAIMDILTAYVRHHARLEPDESKTPPAEVPSYEQVSLTPDISAIMDVIRRRTLYFKHGEPAILNLGFTNLQDAWLAGAHLEEANFEMSRFWFTDFRDAHLERATFEASDLRLATFENANVTGANLRNTKLYGVDLQGANLTGAKLGDADLSVPLNLTQEQLEQASGNEDTQIPPHLKRPASWTENPDDHADLP